MSAENNDPDVLKFKNTFAPHVENEELTIHDIILGLRLSVFDAGLLPTDVQKAVGEYLARHPPEDDD